MGCEYSDWKKLQSSLVSLDRKMDIFYEKLAKELAARLLAKVIKRTPVGDYSGSQYTCSSHKTHKGYRVVGKVGGTLRRGWTGEKKGSGKVQNATAALKVHRFGGTYIVDIVNPVDYASYVEFGRRKVNGGWQPGHFMLTVSEEEIKRIAPALIEKRLAAWLEGAYK